MVRASLKMARIGPQKARLVADMIRGKNVGEAFRLLEFLDKKGAILIKGLLSSAVANAENKRIFDVDRLFVHEISVDGGPVLKRFMPRAKGSAYGLRKRTSHINIVLAER
jgi:large subunit ribosomal protein L22